MQALRSSPQKVWTFLNVDNVCLSLDVRNAILLGYVSTVITRYLQTDSNLYMCKSCDDVGLSLHVWLEGKTNGDYKLIQYWHYGISIL